MAKAARKLFIDLQKDLYLQVQGHAAESHTLPWDVLRQLGDRLQELVVAIARYDLEGDSVKDLPEIKMEFTGFYPGSAVPAFSLHKPESPTLFYKEDSAKTISATFSEIMSYVDKGNYQAIANMYATEEVKNDIVSKVYQFTNATGNAPVQVVRKKTKGEGFTKVYTIRKLSKEIYDKLITKSTKISVVVNDLETDAIAKIKLSRSPSGRVKKTTQEIYTDKEGVLSLKLMSVETTNTKYSLSAPIYVQVNKVSKGYLIENEQFDLYDYANHCMFWEGK